MGEPAEVAVERREIGVPLGALVGGHSSACEKTSSLLEPPGVLDTSADPVSISSASSYQRARRGWSRRGRSPAGTAPAASHRRSTPPAAASAPWSAQQRHLLRGTLQRFSIRTRGPRRRHQAGNEVAAAAGGGRRSSRSAPSVAAPHRGDEPEQQRHRETGAERAAADRRSDDEAPRARQGGPAEERPRSRSGREVVDERPSAGASQALAARPNSAIAAANSPSAAAPRPGAAAAAASGREHEPGHCPARAGQDQAARPATAAQQPQDHLAPAHDRAHCEAR